MKFNKILFLCFFMQATVFGQLKLPGIFSDNMVLQQSAEAKIWGWADADASVVIRIPELSYDNAVKADANGKWSASIKTGKATKDAFKIIVSSGKNTVTINDVLLGEVWFASGQSNMNFPLFATHNADKVVHSAIYPAIRVFSVPLKTTDQLQSDVESKWLKCMPKEASGFSAVVYYFAKQLHEELGVPVGIIKSAAGGTPIESWMDRETLKEQVPALVASYDKFADKWANGEKEKFYKELADYNEKLKSSEQVGSEKPVMPKTPFGPEHIQHPCGLYNGMVHPLVGYTIKGFIWYQGEANSWRAKGYLDLFPAMVGSWRTKWGENLPFYYVQIAPCTYYDIHSMGMKNLCAELREAQRLSLDKIPNSGMAVSLDTVDDYDDIHPQNKEDVGSRLAKIALNKTYNRSVIFSGPMLADTVIKGNKLRLSFTQTQGGLTIKQDDKNWFEIAGSDGKYYPANVEIQGDALVLSSVKVSDPTDARYAWSNTAEATLFNGNGLPASSFTTDNSKWETEGKLTYF